MTLLQDHTFKEFCSISQGVQELSREIRGSLFMEEERRSLHERLEELQDDLAALQLQAMDQEVPVEFPFEALESQIVALYREVEEELESLEISLMAFDALVLKSAMAMGKEKRVVRLGDELEGNIASFFETRLPGIEERTKIESYAKLVDQSRGVAFSHDIEASTNDEEFAFGAYGRFCSLDPFTNTGF